MIIIGNTRKDASETAKVFGSMYLKENLSVREISEKTGYSVNTVKLYLSRYGYACKREQKRNQKERKSKPAKEKINKKPYQVIDDHFVFYKGQVYQKLTREEIYELLMSEYYYDEE